ncbi:MAG TPA: hypothetical protein EYP64_05170, partial [Desulfarculaceae bacterium]|nr:hypothetical protein [Desulfarculaceae bacterium]
MSSRFLSLKTFVMIATAILFSGVATMALPGALRAAENYTLDDCLQSALGSHPKIQIQHFRTIRAQELSRAAKTEFLPKLEAGYSYMHRDKINSYDISGQSFPANTQNVYNLDFTVTQPIFTGFSIIENYRLSQLGIKQALAEERLARLTITYETAAAYFNYLKQTKFTETAARMVERLEAQARDSQLFFDSEL